MITALILGILSLVGFPEKSGDPERVWHVRNESRLAIQGESNVNDFRCEVDSYYSADNLRLYSSELSGYLFSENQMVISLMEFDCGRRLITRDFRESLGADRHPEMEISFHSLDKLPEDNANGEKIIARLRITIAGVTRDDEIAFTATDNGNGLIYLNGKQEFLFSDFNLVPPTKMMGLIHVKNELEVTIDLVLEKLPGMEKYEHTLSEN